MSEIKMLKMGTKEPVYEVHQERRRRQRGDIINKWVTWVMDEWRNQTSWITRSQTVDRLLVGLTCAFVTGTMAGIFIGFVAGKGF